MYYALLGYRRAHQRRHDVSSVNKTSNDGRADRSCAA
jgi:hypothetical protein